MKLSRAQARDLRTGRAWAMRVAALPTPPGPSPATTYASLAADLAQLRAAVAGERCVDRSITDMRRSHDDLDRALAHAIAQAFAADANGASTPEGIVSWAAEGLARCYERELAMFAAIDARGPAQPQSRQARR
ncbi:MAG: hypothetical protein QOC82_1596 [Frankiaceae bacterium]|nr:hypothetical protein [Frankiaceae bacterium]